MNLVRLWPVKLSRAILVAAAVVAVGACWFVLAKWNEGDIGDWSRERTLSNLPPNVSYDGISCLSDRPIVFGQQDTAGAPDEDPTRELVMVVGADSSAGFTVARLGRGWLRSLRNLGPSAMIAVVERPVGETRQQTAFQIDAEAPKPRAMAQLPQDSIDGWFISNTTGLAWGRRFVSFTADAGRSWTDVPFDVPPEFEVARNRALPQISLTGRLWLVLETRGAPSAIETMVVRLDSESLALNQQWVVPMEVQATHAIGEELILAGTSPRGNSPQLQRIGPTLGQAHTISSELPIGRIKYVDSVAGDLIIAVMPKRVSYFLHLKLYLSSDSGRTWKAMNNTPRDLSRVQACGASIYLLEDGPSRVDLWELAKLQLSPDAR